MKKNIVFVALLFLINFDLNFVSAKIDTTNQDLIILNYCNENEEFPNYDWRDVNNVPYIPSIAMTDYTQRYYK